MASGPSKPPSISQSSAPLSSPVSFHNRRGSVTSTSADSPIDKEHLAYALDKIHTSARQSDALTTFNDFAPPPLPTAVTEGKGGAGELVQQGFSGLYSRLREAVGVGSSSKRSQDDQHADAAETASKKSAASEANVSRGSISLLSHHETGGSLSTLSSSQHGPGTEASSSAILNGQNDSRPQLPAPTKTSTSINLISHPKSQNSNRQSLSTTATSSVIPDPPVLTKEDRNNGTLQTHDGAESSARLSLSKMDLQAHLASPDSPKLYDSKDGKLPPRSKRDDTSSIASLSSTSGPSIPPIQTRHLRTPSGSSSMLSPDQMRRLPSAIDRISRSRSPAYPESRDSSTDRGTAAASAISTAAHNSVYHESFAQESRSQHSRSGSLRIPGTTMGHEGASDQLAQLDRMRRQVLSKEFWMKDDTVKECFLCQTPFTAWRRKHHCRTCGCIFDGKCTTVISGEKFGVQGSLRVCRRCLDVISRRLDGSGSEDSGDDQSFMPRFFGSNRSKSPTLNTRSKAKEQDLVVGSEGSEDARLLSAPLMAIPATRRLRESNRSAAILEIDAPQLSRPGSSRSLKSMNSGRPHSSAGHQRHHSKHGLLGRLKTGPEDPAPFRKGINDEASKKPKFPAFHDDNIIDPELADYMSDESSGDEHMSIFASMSTADLHSTSFENERSGFNASMASGKKHHHRGEKSISGLSYLSRGAIDDIGGPFLHRRPTRRRNLSNVSGIIHHMPSPRPKSAVFKGPSASSEMVFAIENSNQNAPQLARHDSFRHQSTPKVKLNKASLHHVDKLLHQLLDDANIPDPLSWQKALIPILLQATDDVDPDVVNGEDMDIRHYVKLKRIPGARPADTQYVSGVIFTKNLALKSMPRRIVNPRIVLVTFPVEYQRHQQQFMSLQPVIEQEKEYLRVVVQRITNLRPHLLLAEKGVSGVALQYLSEANISVAYNVKHTVIEAVARCAETEIISSLDMLAWPVRVGRCEGFEVRTFVNNDHPGRKKSYVFLSGCRPDLGCTIALRGASHDVLARVKYIVEFMVYVVYNLKLESSLLKDESIEPPETGDGSLSNSIQGLNESIRSVSTSNGVDSFKNGGPTVVVNHASSESEPPSQATMDSSSIGGLDEDGCAQNSYQIGEESSGEPPKPDSQPKDAAENQVPDDVPMPTYYSDMIAKYETKILSASPYVKFTQPYLLMRAREQERRLLYLRRLLDHDAVELQEDTEVADTKQFQLIKPEMVEQIGQKAPRDMMEILRAVHDAEYDKARYNYQTQTRQWETYIQGNLDLFDPYSHQNIVVLYSMVCTETKIPCTEPVLVAINFYDAQHYDSEMYYDRTLGQYVEYLIDTRGDVCDSNGCERTMLNHHRTYVHDEARVTVFVEEVPDAPPRRPDLADGISMWTYCKICKKDSEETKMSETTYKYSFGKYLELLYWGRGLRMKDVVDCPHEHHRDHVRYFRLEDCRVRIHWDPIDLLEIVVPRARITWKVANDLKLKNEVYTKMEDRWAKFMSSVQARLKCISIDSVLPEKAESCKVELERLSKKAQEDQPTIVRRLQDVYVNSKYYEVVPFNGVVREMLEKAGEWDAAFAKFEADFLGDKDMRQLTMMQLKKMFADNESKESLVSNEGSGSVTDGEDRPSQTFSEAEEKIITQPTDYTDNTSMETSTTSALRSNDEKYELDEDDKTVIPTDGALERVEPLDLAGSPTSVKSPSQTAATDLPSKLSSSPTKSPPDVPVSPTDTTKPPDPVIPAQDVDSAKKILTPQTSSTSSSVTGIPDIGKQTSDRRSSRKSASNNTATFSRAISQPARPMARSQSSSGKAQAMKSARPNPSDKYDVDQNQAEGSMKIDKKLSDRLGLGALKNRGRNNQSSIPRLVQKKRESKVSTLARHFEQLSREFEKERKRDRKNRAATTVQPRAMVPRTSTKAIVQVYDDVDEALEDPNPPIEQIQERDTDQKSTEASHQILDEPVSKPSQDDDQSHPEATLPPPESAEKGKGKEIEDSSTVDGSYGVSDDEGAASDIEPTVTEEYLPDIKEIADSLEPSTEIPLELPKHQKTSLMKYLTKFWAERSASGWSPLEYPYAPTDHIFVDSDIIVREDEPSSVIALALNSDDYKGKLSRSRQEAQANMQKEAESGHDTGPETGPDTEPGVPTSSEGADWSTDETDLEKRLLRTTATNITYQLKERSASMTCTIFYAEQFDALRRKCGVAERIVESLSRCLKWDSRGGKTKAVFLKTLDDRLILKALSPVETSAFIKFAPGYFNIMAEALFHELPSVIAKMLGFFRVFIKNPQTGTDVKLDLLVTENLFYDRSPSRIFDLKGSMRNRKIQSTGEQNEVLLDENMVEFIFESPLFAREHSKKLLRASVWNDTLFLARQNVMDYSLMIAVDDARKELVVGIIDCIRTYTWDKKLESWIKDLGLGGGGRNRPTVTSPKEYKTRFREAMARYILQSPNCWHLFNNPQVPNHYGRARFEEPTAK